MSRVSVAEDDRLEERGPAEPVHVVDRDVGLEEPRDDRREPAVGRSDKNSNQNERQSLLKQTR